MAWAGVRQEIVGSQSWPIDVSAARVTRQQECRDIEGRDVVQTTGARRTGCRSPKCRRTTGGRPAPAKEGGGRRAGRARAGLCLPGGWEMGGGVGTVNRHVMRGKRTRTCGEDAHELKSPTRSRARAKASTYGICQTLERRFQGKRKPL
jgi:hypothetical protein